MARLGFSAANAGSLFDAIQVAQKCLFGLLTVHLGVLTRANKPSSADSSAQTNTCTERLMLQRPYFRW